MENGLVDMIQPGCLVSDSRESISPIVLLLRHMRSATRVGRHESEMRYSKSHINDEH